MYLRLALVVTDEHRYTIETKLRSCVGDAIRIISICGSIDEARVRSALVEPDVIVIGPGFDPISASMLARLDSAVSPQLILWADHAPELSEGADPFTGRMNLESAQDMVVSLFELCARHVAQRRSMRTQMFRSPEAPYHPDIIALPDHSGLVVRPTDSIIHVKGEGNYTQVTFDRGGDILMSRTIGDYEDALPENTFLRVHRSHIINIRHVRRIIRGKMMRVILSNGDEIEVSDAKREILLGMINIVRRK